MTPSLVALGLVGALLVACAPLPPANPRPPEAVDVVNLAPPPVEPAAAPAPPAPCTHEPRILAPQDSLLGIAVDRERVYWADGVGAVMAVDKRGGPPVTLAKTSLAPQSIAARNGDVFWVEYGVVKAVSGAGGPERTLAGGSGSTRGLAVSGEDLVVMHLDPDSVTAVPMHGGAKRALITGPFGYQVAADAAGVAVFRGTTNSAMDLMIAPAGQDAHVLVAGPLTQGPIVMGGAFVWFGGASGVKKVARAGGEAVLVMQDRALDLAVDGDAVYVLTEKGELKRATRAGDVRTIAAVEGHSLGGLALDDQCVYFAAKGAVMTVAKP